MTRYYALVTRYYYGYALRDYASDGALDVLTRSAHVELKVLEKYPEEREPETAVGAARCQRAGGDTEGHHRQKDPTVRFLRRLQKCHTWGGRREKQQCESVRRGVVEGSSGVAKEPDVR